MFVLAKANILLRSPDNAESVLLARGGLASVPDWAAETKAFKRYVADGLIVPSETGDKAVQAAAEKPVKRRRAKAQDSAAE